MFFVIIIIFIVILNFLGRGGAKENVVSNKETVYRGLKGSFHRKQQNPRESTRTTNWIEVFTTHYCGGSEEEECSRVLNRFQHQYEGLTQASLVSV